jgi:hypothetical protein
MVDLPRPTVDVVSSPATGRTQVTISRDGRGRIYEVRGVGDEKLKDVVEQILNDPYTAEFLPKEKGHGTD